MTQATSCAERRTSEAVDPRPTRQKIRLELNIAASSGAMGDPEIGESYGNAAVPILRATMRSHCGRAHLFDQGRESSAQNSLPDPAHSVEVKMQVMDGGQG